MFRIIKTINEILKKKKTTEPEEYIKGFNDCLELLKIGVEKSDNVNLHWENSRLKRILYKFLNFNFILSDQQILKAKELTELYDIEFILIDKLYSNFISKSLDIEIKKNIDELDVKLQSFMLKEIIFKLAQHKFNLSKKDVELITEITESDKTEYEKIQWISGFISKLDIENSWPDYYKIDEELKTQAKENGLLRKIVELFIGRDVSKFNKYEVAEIYNCNIETNQKLSTIISYIRKTSHKPANNLFTLSHEDKEEIINIIGNMRINNPNFNELFNYINFTVSNNERKVKKAIRKKIGKLK